MLDLIWDMETSDPDDFLTLLFLLGHPEINLKGITITPGTPEQVGLVRLALHWFQRDIPVGAHNLDHPKQCVSAWHYKAYGQVAPSRNAEAGPEMLLRLCDETATLVTGAPLKNLGAAIRLGNGSFRLGRLVAQGGFAGEGVVPVDRQLPKFRGLTTCPTFNLNGDVKSALLALEYSEIGIRRFVSKNVCHQVVYDRALHEKIAPLQDKNLALKYIWQGMDAYLNARPEGKILHDPLAACCAIDEHIGTWAEVELFREKNAWGARLSPGSRTWIITDYDHARFVQTFTFDL
jgi:pyrimidine-specific ribonucleoside hydrolase